MSDDKIFHFLESAVVGRGCQRPPNKVTMNFQFFEIRCHRPRIANDFQRRVKKKSKLLKMSTPAESPVIGPIADGLCAVNKNCFGGITVRSATKLKRRSRSNGGAMWESFIAISDVNSTSAKGDAL